MLKTGIILYFILSLVSPGATSEIPPFRKGVSLQVFTFPAIVGSVYAEDPYPNRAGVEDYFSIARLRASGFDHVRLPVDVGPFLDDPEQRRWREFRIYFRRFIESVKRSGLNVIVTLVAPSLNGQIPEDQLDAINGPRFMRYLDMTERFARELDGWNVNDLALEPMNEPQRACRQSTATDWLDYQDILIPRLRAKAPHLWLGMTGGCWSKIEGLEGFDARRLSDNRTFVSVHFYDPFLFTHQGSDWTLDIMPLIAGLPYPAKAGSLDEVLGNARGRDTVLDRKAPDVLPRAEDAIRNYFRENSDGDAIRARLQTLKEWALSHGVEPGRIVFTEYGAMKTPGGERSRTRWLHDVSSAIAANGWGWTLWVLRQGPFGLDEDGRYDPALFDALGVQAP
jgi:hypothetical protein